MVAVIIQWLLLFGIIYLLFKLSNVLLKAFGSVITAALLLVSFIFIVHTLHEILSSSIVASFLTAEQVSSFSHILDFVDDLFIKTLDFLISIINGIKGVS